MLYISPEANHFHPLWVIVDKLTLGGGPLFSQTTNVQVLILYRQPLSFKPCQEKTQPCQSDELQVKLHQGFQFWETHTFCNTPIAVR